MANFQTLLEFVPVLVISMIYQVPIKTVAMPRTTFPLPVFKGKYLQREYSDLAQIQSHPRFYAFPDYL